MCIISFVLSHVIDDLLAGLAKESRALGPQEPSFCEKAGKEAAHYFPVEEGNYV